MIIFNDDGEFSRKLDAMGSLGSGHRRTRRACVEECQRFPSSSCGRCGRAVRFVYVVPLDVALDRRLDCVTTEGEKACRQCLGLTYRVRQLHKSATLRLLEPMVYSALRSEFAGLVEAGGFSVSDAPPPDVVNQGNAALSQWFRERNARNARFLRVSDQLSAIPAEHLPRLWMNCHIETAPPKRHRARS